MRAELQYRVDAVGCSKSWMHSGPLLLQAGALLLQAILQAVPRFGQQEYGDMS